VSSPKREGSTAAGSRPIAKCRAMPSKRSVSEKRAAAPMLPFELETAVEQEIAADPEWRQGVEWGTPREGHPEGAVKHHIADVLRNVDIEATSQDERRRLRLAALVHDSFKYRAQEGRARVGSDGHHGTHAARFLERFVDEEQLVEVVRWHDEVFAAWLGMTRRGDRPGAEQRVRELVGRLGDALPLYLRFFRADNATEGKSPEAVEWFESILRESAPEHALELTRVRARTRSGNRTA
jgi:hypothetical protein